MSTKKAYIILTLTVGTKKKKKRRRMKEWFKTRHISLFSHEDLLKELKISEPDPYEFFAHGCFNL
jgi:hypothetical protein